MGRLDGAGRRQDMEKSAQCQEAGLDGAGGKRASMIRQGRLQKEAGTDGAGCQEIDALAKVK